MIGNNTELIVEVCKNEFGNSLEDFEGFLFSF